MKAKLNIEGADAYVTDEKPGSAKKPKLILGGVAFDPMDLVKLPGHVGAHIAAQLAFKYGSSLEGEAKALVDEFIRPML